MGRKTEKILDFLIRHIDRMSEGIDAYTLRVKASSQPIKEQPQIVNPQIVPHVEREIIVSREAILELLQKQDSKFTMKDLVNISKSN